MSIWFFNEDKNFSLSQPGHFTQWLHEVAENEGFVIREVNYIFSSDPYVHQINLQYLNHDFFTDIITFDYVKEHYLSGDIFISIDRVEENAQTYQTSFQQELSRVMVHGLLHLCGYPDATNDEKELMREKEDHYLRKLELF